MLAIWVWAIASFGFAPAIWAQGWDWATYANSPAIDRGTAIGVDKSTQEVYVVGSSYGAPSELGLTTTVAPDGFVAKYRPNGTLVWAFSVAGLSADELLGITVDSITHRIYITGYASGTVTVAGRGGTPFTKTATGGQDVMLVALDSAGAVLWGDLEGGPSDDFGTSISQDRSHIYIAGNFTTDATFTGVTVGPSVLIPATGTINFFIAKYRKSDGALSWAVGNVQGSATQRAEGIAVDSNGVYVCGHFDSPSMRLTSTTGNTTLLPFVGPGTDIFLVSLRRTDGLSRWGTVAGSSGLIDESFAVATDGAALYLGGRAGGPMLFPPLAAQATGSQIDAILSRHNPATGDAIWVNVMGAIGGTASETVIDVGIDELGNPWAGGFFANQIHFPNNLLFTTTLTASGPTDLFLTSFTPAGGLNFALQAGGTGSDGVRAISIHDHDNVFVTGVYLGSASLFATLPPTSLPVEASEDILVAKYSLCNAHPNRSLTVTTSSDSICIGQSVDITVVGSEVGTTYQLIDSATGTPIGPTVAGTGGALVFPSGALAASITLAVQAYVTYPTCMERLLTQHRILVFAWPSVNLGQDRTICPGASAIFNAGAGYTGYAWNTTETSQSITATAAGSYHVTVTDPRGCTDADTVNLSLYTVPVINLGPDISQCGGFGPILSAGPGFVTYLWSTFQPSMSITATSPGTYSITATTADGCQARDTIVVNLFALPTPNLGPDTIICAGSTVVLNPGTGYASYLWNTSATTPTITVGGASTYAVTVTDGNGCQNNDAIVVSVAALPMVNLGNDTSVCEGVGFTLDPGPGYALYNWSTGATSQAIVPITSGNHAVTVTDGLGCTGSDQIGINLKPSPTPDLGPDAAICADDSLTLATSAAYAAYLWSTGAVTPTVTVSATGNYAVTVTAANNCSGSDTLALTVNPRPIVDIGPDDTLCMGETLVLDAGAGQSAYAWSTLASTQSIIVGTTGTYQVTVTDANSCTASDTMALRVLDLPIVDLGADTAICQGDSLLLDAGAGQLSYLWTNGMPTQAIWATSAGTYAVAVTDSSLCVNQDTIVVGIFARPTVDLGPDTAICMLDTLWLDAGPGPLSYLWGSGSTQQTIAASTSGLFRVTVTDANGCSDSDSLTLSINALPTVSLGTDTTICLLDTLLLDAGPAMTSYAWSTGAATQTIRVTSGAAYSVTVTNGAGCLGSDTLNLAVNLPPMVNLGNDTTVCTGASILLDPGSGGATYQWAHGPTSQTVTISTPGSYAVTATSAMGCPAHDSILIGNHAVPALQLASTGVICAGDSLLLDPNLIAATYLWSTGATSPTIYVSQPDTYYVDVVDTNGCAGSDTTMLSWVAPPTVALGGDTSLCPSALPLELDAGNAGATYLWTTGDSTQTIDVFAAGVYGVQLTDTNGCSGADSILLSLFPTPVVDLGPDTSICEGTSLPLSVNPPAPSILWSTGDSTAAILISVGGTYWVDVVDTNGCRTSDSVTVATTPLPMPHLGADTTICAGSSIGLASQQAGAHIWSTGDTTATIVVSSAGMVTVTVTAAGCSGMDTIIIAQQALPIVDIGPDLVVCPGDSVTLSTSGSGSLLWSTGSQATAITIGASGIYWLQVTDSMRCAASDSMTLSLSPSVAVSIGNLAEAYCATDPPVQLSGQPAGGAFSGAATSSGLFDPSAVALGLQTMTYAYVDSNGCTWQSSASTTLFAPPSPAYAGPDQTAATQVTLQATPPTVGQGHWELGSLAGTLSDPLDPSATLNSDATGLYDIVWVVENAPCAPSRDTMRLLLEGIFVPTGFSPNGDGTNDTYVIRGITAFPDARLSIFNRWGNLVWQADGYHNEWDGSNAHGQPLSDDTYFAVVEYNGRSVSTFVLLKRVDGQ